MYNRRLSCVAAARKAAGTVLVDSRRLNLSKQTDSVDCFQVVSDMEERVIDTCGHCPLSAPRARVKRAVQETMPALAKSMH